MAYTELHCLTNFSFLRGASHAEELVTRAQALGYNGLAITDECSLAGVVRAHVAARDLAKDRAPSAPPFQLIIGSELLVPDVSPLRLVLLAPTREAYGQLSQLITTARRRCDKGQYRVHPDDLELGSERRLNQVLALWLPDWRLGTQAMIEQATFLQRCFPGRLWITLELFLDGNDINCTAELLTLSMYTGLPMVAAGDVHMHVPERKPLQDVLTATRLGVPVSGLGTAAQPNRERHLRPIDALQRIYPQEMLNETKVIAHHCTFSLDELRYEYPEEVVPPQHSATSWLRELTIAGAANRWPEGAPAEVWQLVEHELVLIAELRYEHFFLTVHDIVQFARSEGILCQGRGSAANSAVCYCLGITEVDPSRMSLLFERFISKERNEPPDIDVDFEHARREEVMQYIYRRYGRERAGLAATVISYRPKSAIRDVGKAMGLDASLIDHLAKSMAWWDKKEELHERLRSAGVEPDSAVLRQFLSLVHQILGFPRHLSQHVGGFVISQGPLAQLVPVENAAMANRTVIQWDKDDLEALGLLKVDVLALGMLTAIQKALVLVAAMDRPGHPTPLTLATVPAEDPATYLMLQQGDSTGVFQVESRAQMAMLPRLKPACFYDLVVQVAIVRPGPIQGDMVHPYLRRRQGLEQAHYPNDAVRGVLERTLGVPIFQEQVIKLAMVAAGFSAGEADQLRRAMAAWKRKGGLEVFHRKLVDGMRARGHSEDFAERVFSQIKGFGEYGFPESHAASFALLVYVSAWLKRHEPAAFCCALLNSQPMGFYTPSQLTQDARRHGVQILPADVTVSIWDHTLEWPQPSAAPPEQGAPGPCPWPHSHPQPAVRLGLRLVKGFKETAANRICASRQQQPFASLEDLARRANLDRGELATLARSGALQHLSGNRHQAHWEVAALAAPTPLWTQTMANQAAEPGATYQPEIQDDTEVSLPTPGTGETLLADYASTGLTLGQHPMAWLRANGAFDRCASARQLRQLPHGRFVRTAGVVTNRQRPGTASGVLFMTLEDETGNTNVVVWASVQERFRAAILQGKLVEIRGTIERTNSVVHLVAGYVSDVSELLLDLGVKSRNFH